jgi:hypothetical protein
MITATAVTRLEDARRDVTEGFTILAEELPRGLRLATADNVRGAQ